MILRLHFSLLDTVVEITSFTKASKITREATEEDFIPDGVVKSAKDSLQRSFSKGSQKSFEKDEELKMLNPGTIKKVASAFDESANVSRIKNQIFYYFSEALKEFDEMIGS